MNSPDNEVSEFPKTCSILSAGCYLPKKILTNHDLEQLVETSDEWITTRTGIKERRIAGEQEFTSDMATEAAKVALERAQLSPKDIDLIIVATITPDMMFPATACLVQRKLGANHAFAFDLEAACSGFVYAMEIGQRMIRSGAYRYALIIGAEKLSSIVNWTDRNTCVLFGDGAGAAILGSQPNRRGILDVRLGADGGKADLLSMPGGGSRCPATKKSVESGMHFLQMDGKETFKSAVQAMYRAAVDSMHRAGVTIEEIACIIPHQANQRIITAVSDRLGAKADQVFVNVHKYGNTSAASVIIALAEAVEQGRVRRGDLVLLVVFGAGLTWGAAVLEW